MSLKDKSKYLSLLLRHAPEKGNVTLNKAGWCVINDLISNAGFTLKELNDIVETDNKGRYEFNEDFTMIRAVQGHSIQDVYVEMEHIIPPYELLHGTKEEYLDDIMKTGIDKMSRLYVHLSDDINTAKSVADRRKGKSVILSIDAMRMRADGYKFFLSKNRVFLVDHVPSKYITIFNEGKQNKSDRNIGKKEKR